MARGTNPSSAAAWPSPRRFGFTVGPALLVVAAYLAWRARVPAAQVVALVGVVLCIVAALAPRLLKPVVRAWMSLGHVMGLVMTPVVFTLLWWIAFVPMGVLRRTLSRSPLARDPHATSYWVRRAPSDAAAARARLSRQF